MNTRARNLFNTELEKEEDTIPPNTSCVSTAFFHASNLSHGVGHLPANPLRLINICAGEIKGTRPAHLTQRDGEAPEEEMHPAAPNGSANYWCSLFLKIRRFLDDYSIAKMFYRTTYLVRNLVKPQKRLHHL